LEKLGGVEGGGKKRAGGKEGKKGRGGKEERRDGEMEGWREGKEGEGTLTKPIDRNVPRVTFARGQTVHNKFGI
jgi:hypothetical protein